MDRPLSAPSNALTTRCLYLLLSPPHKAGSPTNWDSSPHFFLQKTSLKSPPWQHKPTPKR